MIVRTSGPEAFQLAANLNAPDLPPAAATRARLKFTNLKTPATLYAFAAPRSHTGEDVVEYHLPGNPLLARLLLDALIDLGARQAEPGEFSARAHFNGKTDLAAAEGVAAAIAARSESELAAARRLAAGELSTRLAPILDRLAETLALLEVGLDFAEEDVTVLPAADLRARLDELDAACAALLADTARFDRLHHEPRVVLVGRPNAGKSTLLNALAGTVRAVVSDVPGTTRDALTARLPLRRGLVTLTDVAGLADAAGEVESQMQAAARRAAAEADVLVLVRDATDGRQAVDLPRDADLVVLTKIDLLPESPVDPRAQRALFRPTDEKRSLRSRQTLPLCAPTGAGLEALKKHLDALAFGSDASPALALNARHEREIAAARAALSRARDGLGAGDEITALDLRDALDALGRVLGTVTPDDLLGRIFSTFCIGK